MSTALDIIEKLRLPSEFGINSDSEAYYYLESIERDLHKDGITDFDIANGASKMVIVPEDDDYVVKISFNGYWTDSYDEEYDEYGEEEFIPFDALEDGDYCAEEYRLYLESVDNGVSDYFASMEYICDANNGMGCYIQEKVTMSSDDCSSHSSEDSREYVQGKYAYYICSKDWDAACIDTYGEESYTKFREFCFDYSISDMHSGNYGWRDDGSPVILDYSGYYDN